MMMGLAAAELSAPDPRLVLRKRLCEEMEALRGILRKAEFVVLKTVDKGRPAPRCGKNGRFLAAEARSETMEANRISCDKKRKTMPPVAVDVEIIKPRMMETDRTPCAKRRKAMPPVKNIEPPRIRKADQTPCAKKRRTMPLVEIVEPRISQDEIFSLVTRLSSLSSNMPVRILEFLNKECTGHTDQKAGEIEIDLGSMRRSAMFELQKLLDEFAEEEKRRQQQEPMNVSRSISRSSPRELEEGEFIEEGKSKGLCSPPQILGDGEMTEEEEEEVDICGDTGPIAIEKFVETAKSPSSKSSSSSSSGSSISSGSSSGSSSSDSSASNSSDSDCDDECATSNPAPAVVPKTDICPMTMPHKVVGPSSLLEDGEIEEEQESSGASPVAAEKFAETVNSTGSANGQCIRSSPAPAVRPEPSKTQPAAQGTVRHLYAKDFEKKPERAAAAHDTVGHLCAKAFEKKRERQRAYQKLELEEMERNAKAKSIFDWIHPTHLRQLGITTPVEYGVTSERRLPARRGCPVQSLLGLFLKAE